MENILLVFLRETRHYSTKTIARHLGVGEMDYLKIESGKTLITKKQAEQLGGLFKVKGRYIYKAALQSELLMIRNELLKGLKWKIEKLEERLGKADGYWV